MFKAVGIGLGLLCFLAACDGHPMQSKYVFNPDSLSLSPDGESILVSIRKRSDGLGKIFSVSTRNGSISEIFNRNKNGVLHPKYIGKNNIIYIMNNFDGENKNSLGSEAYIYNVKTENSKKIETLIDKKDKFISRPNVFDEYILFRWSDLWVLEGKIVKGYDYLSFRNINKKFQSYGKIRSVTSKGFSTIDDFDISGDNIVFLGGSPSDKKMISLLGIDIEESLYIRLYAFDIKSNKIKIVNQDKKIYGYSAICVGDKDVVFAIGNIHREDRKIESKNEQVLGEISMIDGNFKNLMKIPDNIFIKTIDCNKMGNRKIFAVLGNYSNGEQFVGRIVKNELEIHLDESIASNYMWN